MTAKERAAYYDAHDDPVNATEAYEEAILSPHADLETYLNLAVLYFCCWDFGYLSHHHLTDEFVAKTWDRPNELLNEATTRFGNNAEIEFWRIYFPWFWVKEPLIVDECKKIVESSDTLIPYFYLYSVTSDEQYYPYVVRLLETVKDRTTEKKRFIWSIIDSSLTSREWRLSKPSQPNDQ
jgi:hypothetical protein